VTVELWVYGALMAALSGEGEDSNVGANTAFKAANCKAVATADAVDGLKCADLFDAAGGYTGAVSGMGKALDLVDMRPASGLALAGAIFYFIGYILNHVMDSAQSSAKKAKGCGNAEDWKRMTMVSTANDQWYDKIWYGFKAFMMNMFVVPGRDVMKCARPALVLGRETPGDITGQQNVSGPPAVEADNTATDATYTDW